MINQLWNGRFESSEAAASQVGSASPSEYFASERWQEGQISTFLALGRGGVELTSEHRPTLLPLMLAMAGSVSVIDLGGSSGWCLQASLGAGADVEKYVVVELPCVIEGMAHLATGVLSFQEWQEALLDESVYQVMYVNSVLQYLDNNDLLLTLVKAKAPHFVLLDELLWSPTTFDWYTIQRNLDSPAVVRFASEQKLTSALKELGYRCVWRRLSANAGEWHFPDMAEFGQDVAVDGRLSLLFINDG